jgi:hypothetical protein
MPRFQLHERVSRVDNPHRTGTILHILALAGGFQAYEVSMDGGGIETVFEHDLQPARQVRSAWDLLEEGSLQSYQDFGVATTLHKVRNATTNTVSSLRASRTLFKPYQYKPLVKLLQSDTKRILIADEVGLGKTIEAGHIMLELRGRRRLRSALIVCPRSLQENWERELREKFSFSFKIPRTGADFLEDLRLDHNRGCTTTFAIVSYEKCRNREFIRFLEKTGYMFDLVVCDESHRLRNSGTQLYKAFRKVVMHAEAIAFLSATPIMLTEEDLYNQIRLLEPDRYNNAETFRNAIAFNRPFIKALQEINSGRPIREIADRLHRARVKTTVTIDEELWRSEERAVGELLAEDPLYSRARTTMLTQESTPATRASVQHDLSELNSLNHLYTRTRKRDVTTDRMVVKRRPQKLGVRVTDEERAFISWAQNEYDGLRGVTFNRMIASSHVAYRTSHAELDAGEYRRDFHDSKFDKLWEIIEEVVLRAQKKLIIFSTFKKTLRYIRIRLAERDIQTAMIHGGVPDRDGELERFRADNSVKVLLASEVGREGINLQFCDALVNYDLPWNPMNVEQRIGRIDRIGQESEVIHIYSLTISGSIDDKVYERLLERIGVFRNALGDLEDILAEEDSNLGKQINVLERQLYSRGLTDDQKNELIDQLAQAIETERLNLRDIEERLTDSIVSDAHFQNEIDKIVRDRRYLTDVEIARFVESAFRDALPTHRLIPQNDGKYVLHIPVNDRHTLFDFIEDNIDNLAENRDLSQLYYGFKVRVFDRTAIPVTFRQDIAYKSADKLEFINSYHPLVNAIQNYFHRRHLGLNRTFALALKRETIPDSLRLQGEHYLLVVYKIRIEKDDVSERRQFNTIHSLLVDLNGEEPEIMKGDVADEIMGIAQKEGKMPQAIPSFNGLSELIRTPVQLRILEHEMMLHEDEKVRMNSSVMRRRMQQEHFFRNQIERKEQLLYEGRGIRRILESDIAALEEERDRVLASMEEPHVESGNEVVSINYLQII